MDSGKGTFSSFFVYFVHFLDELQKQICLGTSTQGRQEQGKLGELKQGEKGTRRTNKQERTMTRTTA